MIIRLHRKLCSKMRNPIKQFCARLHFPTTGVVGRVEFDESSFHVHGVSGFGNKDLHVRWSDVTRIEAFKRDLGTVDTICVAIQIDGKNGVKEWIELPEELEQFNALLCEVERRFHISSDWWSKVAFPAFATNDTNLNLK